jgi:hypothetical protein
MQLRKKSAGEGGISNNLICINKWRRTRVRSIAFFISYPTQSFGYQYSLRERFGHFRTIAALHNQDLIGSYSSHLMALGCMSRKPLSFPSKGFRAHEMPFSPNSEITTAHAERGRNLSAPYGSLCGQKQFIRFSAVTFYLAVNNLRRKRRESRMQNRAVNQEPSNAVTTETKYK